MMLAAIAGLSAQSPSHATHCTISEPCDLGKVGVSTPAIRARSTDRIDAESGRPCSDAPAFVRAAGLERRMICAAIRQAVEMLAACRISMRAPIFAELSEKVVGPDGEEMFGRYDRIHDTVVVASYSAANDLAKGTPYAALAPSDFYRSLIVHETVHAIMEQNQTAQPSSRAVQEYPAYAIQWASTSSVSRDAFLRQFDVADPNVADIFSDAILMFDPYYFGARAYAHFNRAPDRCGILQALLADRATFVAQQ